MYTEAWPSQATWTAVACKSNLGKTTCNSACVCSDFGPREIELKMSRTLGLEKDGHGFENADFDRLMSIVCSPMGQISYAGVGCYRSEQLHRGERGAYVERGICSGAGILL